VKCFCFHYSLLPRNPVIPCISQNFHFLRGAPKLGARLHGLINRVNVSCLFRSRFDWSNCGVLRRRSLSRMRMLIVIVIGVALSCFSLCPFLYGPIIFEHLWQFEWLLCHDISTSTAFNLMMTILLMKLKKKADSCERWQKRAKSETKRKCPPPEISVKTSIRRIHCP